MSVSTDDDHDVQFPDPYIVPVYFSRDVMDSLTYGKMNVVTQNAFLLGVASHVFQIKRKPSSEDLINVSRAIITKYPFMRSPTGSPYVSILYTFGIKLNFLPLHIRRER